MRELYKTTGGDLREIEVKLQLQTGQLNNSKAAIIDNRKLKMPSGNEVGADLEMWMPGGYTGKGVPEAILPGVIYEKDVIVKTIGELFNEL